MKPPQPLSAAGSAHATLIGHMASGAKSIYVEIAIHAPIERVWEMTQTPDLHERWDLRFTEIRYLPRPDPAEPQKFRYATRIGFGLDIAGEGESMGSHDGPDGARSSALKFWSDDRKSLIREGSGYWRYVPDGKDHQTTRFFTGYDYQVRFGWAGRMFDRIIFRPLMGWATAWSFDRLRLWIEKGIDPASAMRQSIVHAAARLTVAFVWLYEGIFPKLIGKHPDELAMLRSAGFAAAREWCIGIGWAEVGIGLAMLLVWRWRWPLWFTLAAMPLAAVGVAISSPRFLIAPFNPIAFNSAVFALTAIGILAGRDLPSARRCLRRPSAKGG
jgi:DoxX-like family